MVASLKTDTMDEVWIVDDDQSIRWVLERALSREGFRVRSFHEARGALAALEESMPRVLVSDIRMPGESGIDLLYQARQKRPAMPVIIMTAYGDLDSAVSAFQGGAFEYLPKPFDLTEAVELIRRAVNEQEARAEPAAALNEAREMLGQAPAMQEVFRAIGRLSQSSVTVLVTGESGSGKELIARALHRHSARAHKPFVALNMAAIPRDLLESELFGHERGSFTGAQQLRRGRFEQADGGTLFLDEIGDMPPEMQTRLLRVLSEGHYYRVGGHQAIKSNVRVIAATHQHLEERVRQGLFREDLFHRLNVIRLRIPPLRERTEDIGLLARHFLQRYAADLGVETKRLSAESIEALARYSWPGNVRQLENVCNWLTVMAPSQNIAVRDLPPEVVAARQEAAEVAARPAIDPGDGGGLAERGESAVVRTGIGGLVAGSEGLGSLNPAALAGADAARDAGRSVRGDEEGAWAELLSREATRLLAATYAVSEEAGGDPKGVENEAGVMAKMTRLFEATMIRSALRVTRGRRVEAAQRLGIGRNTITRKIQELGLDDE